MSPVPHPVHPVVARHLRYLVGNLGRPYTTVRGRHQALASLFRFAADLLGCQPDDDELLDVIDLEVLLAWQQWLRKHRRPNTVHSYSSHARVFFGWCASRASGRILDENPAADLVVPAPERRPADPIEDADLELALTAAAAADPQMYAMLTLAAGLGFRCQAIAQVGGPAVRWDDERREVFVSVIVKGGKPHVGKGGPVVYQALLPFRHKHGPWFTAHRMGPGGKPVPVKPRQVSEYINKFFRDLGIGKTAHKARKWAATTSYFQRRDVLATMAFLGHSSPVSILPYVELVEGAGGGLSLDVDATLAKLVPLRKRAAS